MLRVLEQRLSAWHQKISPFLKKKINVYLFLRESERENGSGGEAERGDTESEAGSSF